MGYFDALTSSYFKTAPNGQKLFFPWGIFGRGYAIPSQDAFESLRRKLKIYTVIMLVLIIGASATGYYLIGIGIAAASMIFYAVWSRFLLSGLQRTEERLSMTDSMTSQAMNHNPIMLWFLEVVSVLFVVTGLVLLMVDRDNLITAVCSIAFFGVCAVFFARMLLIRRRANAVR